MTDNPFKPEVVNYLTKEQLNQFQLARRRGQISVFRQKPCPVCKEQMPSSVEFCSKACYEVRNPPQPKEGDKET